MKRHAQHAESSGNVFADLQLPDADERLLKAELAAQIHRFINRKGWTQAEAAEAIGLDQPRVSNLMRGRLSGFSIERLFRVLNRLGHRVEVKISTRELPPEDARTLIKVA